MLGSMLAGSSEGGGKKVTILEKEYVEFYGMSSKKANEKHNGGSNRNCCVCDLLRRQSKGIDNKGTTTPTSPPQQTILKQGKYSPI